ncbi:MAG TPA: glutathionylspermidine synthase family protein [Tenuifilaceae bacterium]|nr:glutathionylspermidine synthase family protein [Tenuifilaceae bacterium]HPI45557.1 glutathionylspermidine synthase family protein [Tenuifilaceae bacterium]HPN20901.1 glutathionylspermidine synthase family protein [Tenuifilaceae bacterium]
MRRHIILPRSNWQEKVESIGFKFHSSDATYWDESVYYEFTMDEIETIEKATSELWDMCLIAVQYVIDHNLYNLFHIPEWFVPHIESTWNNDAPSIYGRFDFSFNNGVPKLLEFNADTPTSLFESSVVQWYWLQDFDKSKDQFNSIHEKLVEYWKHLKDYLYNDTLYFTTIKDTLEDFTTTEYLRDCAIQAGLNTKYIYIDEIGWDNESNVFVDLENKTIRNIFKLYPYEWLVNEEFGKNITIDRNNTHWIEPSWKMLLSNKAILPILWQLNKGHKNLLECYFEKDKNRIGFNYVKKPILSREGANIQIVKHGNIIQESAGEYGDEGFIYQELSILPEFSNNYALIGSWIVGQEPAGIGIRESKDLITGNLSRFVPHLIYR